GDLVWTRCNDEDDKAVRHYRRAISLIESIPDSPENSVSGPDGLSLNEKLLSVTQMAYKRLGERFETQGQTAEALDAYRRALEECEKLLAAGEPRKAQAEVVLAIALGNVGRLEAAAGDASSGMAKVQKGIEICERAVTADPKNYHARTELGMLYWSAGLVGLTSGNAGSALSNLEKARSIQQGLLDLNPGNIYNLGNLAETLAAIGQARERNGETGPARDAFRRSYDIWNEMKSSGTLPGYYSGRPELMLAALTRIKK